MSNINVGLVILLGVVILTWRFIWERFMGKNLNDYEAKDLENLETHLLTFLNICRKTILQFSQLKKHFLDNHKQLEQTRYVTHVKPYRDNNEVCVEKNPLIRLSFSRIGREKI